MELQSVIYQLIPQILSSVLLIVLLSIPGLLLFSRLYYRYTDGTISEPQIRGADENQSLDITEIIIESINNWHYKPSYESKESNASRKGHEGKIVVEDTSHPFIVISENKIKSSTVQRSIGAAREAAEREGYESKRPYIFIFGNLSSNAENSIDNIRTDIKNLYKPSDIKTELSESNQEPKLVLKPKMERIIYKIGELTKEYII